MRLTQDQSNKFYNLISDNYFILTFKDLSDLISFLAFLSNRKQEHILCTSEVIGIDDLGNVGCNNPDPWINKYYNRGLEVIADAPSLASFIAKQFPRLIDE